MSVGGNGNVKVTSEAHTSGQTVAAVTGAVGSVAGNVGGNVVGSVGSLAAQAKLDVNAEADAALADINLDKLLKNAATWPTHVVPGSVVDQIADD